jgi:cytochrome P450
MPDQHQPPDRFSAVGATSYTMQGIVRSAISNPNICHQLQHEIDMMVEEQGISTTECAADAIIKTMPYLQACISEGLRMYPAITQLRERVVPPEGDNIHGHYVPGGTFIALNGLASHLDPVYGDELDAFSPERWLDEDKILLARMQRNLDLTFGYGSSKCLGENLARMELNKIIFEVSASITALNATAY